MENLNALPTGMKLAGDYRTVRVLGFGGFGLTYLAHDETLNRPVTIKEYFPSDFALRERTLSVRPKSGDCQTDYDWGLERFVEEAQTLAKFDHPHINRVYRYFRDNNTAYIVLQFEEGRSLKSWLNALGRAPRQEELDEIVAPLLDALQLIHEHDFLHRDIAPDNIIIRVDGGPVLIDFGSARGDMVQLSKTVSALVKPGYSPYEQYALSGRQQGPWTDIYSLGATLYQAISGKRPTDAPTRIVADDYKPAAEVALSSYRPQFLAAIDQALKLKVEQRPQSIMAWRRKLLTGEASKPRKVSTVAAAVPAVVPQPPAPRKPVVVRPDAARRSILRRKLISVLEGVAGQDDGTPPKKLDAAPKKPGDDAIRAKPKAGQAASQRRNGLGSWLRRRKQAADKPLPGATARNRAPAAAPALEIQAAPLLQDKANGPARRTSENVGKPQVRQQTQAGRGTTRRATGSRLMGVKLVAGAALAAVLVHHQDAVRAWMDHAAEQWANARSAVRGQQTQGAQASDVRTGSIMQPDPDWQPQVDQKPVILRGHLGSVNGLVFTADGQRIVSTSADGTMRLWTVTGEIVRTVEAGTSQPTALDVADGMAAIAHQDGTVELWDVETGTRVSRVRRNEALIWSVVFAGRRDRMLTAGHDWAVTLWQGTGEASSSRVLEGHESAVQALAYAKASGLTASGGADKTIRLWREDDDRPMRVLRGHSDFVTSLAFSQDGSLLASASLDGRIRIWSVAEDGALRTLRGHEAGVTSVAFLEGAQLVLSGSEDGTARLWNWRRGRVVRTFSGHEGAVQRVAVAPGGRYVATGGKDGTIRIWDLQSALRSAASKS